MKLIIKDVPCILKQRQWMRAAKAFRFYLELPQNPIMAAQLTALIDMQVNATIAGHDLSPALVVDIPSKGTRFQLVLETCFEHQNSIGPKLTAFTGEYVPVSLAPLSDSPPEEKRGSISPESTKTLHAMFFKNRKFWEFVETKTKQAVSTEAECKTAYKEMLGTESIKHLEEETYRDSIQSFNVWLNSGA